MAIIAHGSELQDPPHIDGRRLRFLNPRERAELAVDLIERGGYSVKATAKACGVSPSTVYSVSRELVPQAPKPPVYLTHAEWWRSARFSDRVDFVHACGEGEVWDALSTAVA